MEVSEREKRETLAEELADIYKRQEAIVQFNNYFQLDSALETEDSQIDRFRTMVEEDTKNLRMIESVINSFGIRVAPRETAESVSDLLLETLETDSSPLEQLGLYCLIKQNQALCCHLVHKSAQVSEPDIKLALGPLAGVYANFSRQITMLLPYLEEFGVQWITGKQPKGGILGRARDAVATVAGAVMGKVAKPTEDMNVMTVLSTEHRKVDALFMEIKNAADNEAAKALFDQLKADLTSHSIAEEDVVYSRFQPNDQERVRHAREEHAELRVLLDEISYLVDDQEHFHDRLDELKDKVQHHVREEETEMFRLIKENSSEEEQIALCRKFLAEKRLIQQNVGTDEIIASAVNQGGIGSQTQQGSDTTM